MKIEKLGPEAVQNDAPKPDETEAGKNAKPKTVKRLNDDSLDEVAGGVYCTACHRYFVG